LLIDTHAHINDPDFADDLPLVLGRAHAAGVGCIICVGYDVPTSARAIELAERDPQVFATVGLHPNSVAAAAPDWRQQLARLARHPRVVAIGETGLDYYRDWTRPEDQATALHWHLDLADDLGLPIVIHNRNADDDVTDALVGWGSNRRLEGCPGVLHSFAGAAQMLDACVRAGFAISFSGMLTFQNKSLQHLAEAARAAPEEALLIETDAPYLAPVPCRGQRNEPALVRHTAARLAALRLVEVDDMERILAANTRRVFPRLADAIRD
jgi:TatD DNase family protein